eukprot:5531732-Prymnesium_polylepis.1
MPLSLRRVPCTLDTSAIHIKCTSLTPQQPNAAVAAPSVMHAPHERDSPQVHQPHARSQRPAVLSAAAQCSAIVAP